jgi:mannose-6-phosphate isomerase
MSDDSVRPWGSYQVLSDGADFKTKIITVRPQQRLSYQRHTRRSEHWFVVKGSGTVTLDGVEVAVTIGSAVDVPVGMPHRIQNDAHEDLVFVEVQHGEYFGEDDILRLEDDYGRTG